MAAVETAPGQHRCPRWTFSALSRVGNVLVRVRLQVREVDQPVLGKAWMQRDVPEAKPARGSSDDRWRVADRLRVEHAVVHNPQTAGALGDQDVAVREKRERRRSKEALDRGHAKALSPVAQDLRRVCERIGAFASSPTLLGAAHCDEQDHRQRHERHGRTSQQQQASHRRPPESGSIQNLEPDRYREEVD